ncbi:potassium channel family protein [Sphingomonas oryzagri]|uniref:Potassium channel family protein n=1 Tax=Sphingomonas oryzagri TaxID=3042314 RepID=A0ABT6N323_9SPHN|nr:potassium channel family protein [Sphingomonas oryzagri]MDH7639714.1 potassium channel family protein [Sphingomonas oryzagri]
MSSHAVQPHRADWSLSALLAIQAVTLFGAIPLGTRYPDAHILLDACRLTFAAVSIAALTRHRGLQIALLLLLVVLTAVPIFGLSILRSAGFTPGDTLQHDLIEIMALAFNTAVTALVARHVFGPGRVNMHRVQGAVLIYLNIAALFAILFNALLTHWPGAIILTTGSPLPSGRGEQTAALTYFSLATITTTGYGDVVPVDPLARSLANLESVIGQLFPATLLARIVALNLEHGRSKDSV